MIAQRRAAETLAAVLSERTVPPSHKSLCTMRIVGGPQADTWSVPPREPQKSAFQRGYTKAWSKAAKAFRLKYPLCGMRPDHQPPVMSECDQLERSTPATLVDHVVPHRGDHTLFWDEQGNWQSLCFRCHTRKTAAEDAAFAEANVKG